MAGRARARGLGSGRTQPPAPWAHTWMEHSPRSPAFNLSDLKAQIPSGCGGKAVGLRHISHLGTLGSPLLRKPFEPFGSASASPGRALQPPKSQWAGGAGAKPPADITRRNSPLLCGAAPTSARETAARAGGLQWHSWGGEGELRSQRACMREKSPRSCYTVRSNNSLGTFFRL